MVNVTTDTGAGNMVNHTGDLRFCAANAQPGDTIDFSQGLNGKTILLNSQIALNQGGIGITMIGQDQTNPNNPVPVNVTISGQTKTRAFEIKNGANILIQDLVFTAGNGTDGNGNSGNGGAILVDSGAYAIFNTDTFNNNNTTANNTNGGAIENDGSIQIYGSQFSANNSVGNGGAIENTSQLSIYLDAAQAPTAFYGNTAANGTGGAIDSSGNGNGSLSVTDKTTFDKNSAQNGGAIATNDPTTLTNDSFGSTKPNIATVGGGGALYATSGTQGSPFNDTVTACTFANNQGALAGGAIYTTTTMDVEQSSFSNNNSSQIGGGLCANFKGQPNEPMENGQQLTVNLDTFDNNTSQSGGGVYGYGQATTNGQYRFYVTNDTFSNNKAQGNGFGEGGGLYIAESTAGATTYVYAELTNLTFFKNTSDDEGGGLTLSLKDSTGDAQSCSAVLTSLTVNQNTAATDGGGMYINSSLLDVVQVTNSIFDGNKVTAPGFKGSVDVSTIFGGIPLKDNGFNLVGSSDAGLFIVASDKVDPNNNPGLADSLAANGAPAGYPLTLALQNTSLGYETGNQNMTATGSQEDERGFYRQTGKVSIGAEDPDALPPG